jgi:LPS sulfotransferase NodH
MTLTLTVDQINIILNALGAAPYAQVANLIAEIQKQGQAQLATSVSEEASE